MTMFRSRGVITAPSKHQSRPALYMISDEKIGDTGMDVLSVGGRLDKGQDRGRREARTTIWGVSLGRKGEKAPESGGRGNCRVLRRSGVETNKRIDRKRERAAIEIK